MLIADMILDLRLHIDDKITSKLERMENLSQFIDGTNKTFYVSNFPIVTGTLEVIVDGTVTTPASIVIANGKFVMTNAPTLSCYATYNWQFYSDDEITDFINTGLRQCGYTDISLVPEGLTPAVHFYALSHAWEALYGKHMEYFSAQAAGKGIDKNDIATRLQKQSDEAFKDGDNAKKDFYQKQGRQYNPSQGQMTISETPYTPRR